MGKFTIKDLSQKRLKEVLNYDPHTGIFTWKVSRQKCKKGSIAGGYDNGYKYIMVDDNNYKANRLAFLYMKGYFPEYDVDHEDRDRGNDKWNNLRHVSRQCNNRNSGNSKSNTSGVKGVSWITAKRKWCAQVVINRKPKHLGYYKSFINAVCARLTAEQCLNWGDCNKSTPAFMYVDKYLAGRNPDTPC